MIHLTVDVTTVDGHTGTYRVTPRVQIDFERHFKMPIITAFSDAPAMEHLFWLGWKAAAVAGGTHDTFEGWLDTVEQVVPTGVDSDPLPKG